jgi:uncharacterized protein YecT (DUF1311 family)
MTKDFYRALLCIFLLGLASRAHAFDCSEARTIQEKTICADLEAKRADDEMNTAFQTLWSKLLPDQQKAMQDSQRVFLQRRDQSCDYNADPKLATCLLEKTQERLQFLKGSQSSGPGAGRALQPHFIQSRGEKGQYDIYVDALEFPDPVTPGERLFNGEIDKILQNVPKPLKIYEPERRSALTYDLSMKITYASPQFLSAEINIWDFSGGAHGNGGERNLNIDMERGLILTFHDVFDPDAAVELSQECVRQIERQKQEKMPGGSHLPSQEEIQKTIRETVPDLSHWSFSAQTASVIFNPYEVGSYAEGQYECTFPASLLRPLRKLEFVVPRA